MALTANRELDRCVGEEVRSLPVAATTRIYKGALVGLSSGYARGLVAGDEFAGIAYEEMDNSSGAAGAKRLRVWAVGDFYHALSGASVANNKAPVFATEDGTLSYTPNGSFVGFQQDVPEANTILVRIEVGPVAPLSGKHQLTTVAEIAAAGANQGAAAALTADNNFVTAADDAKGVRLPSGKPGMRIFVKNTVANKILKIYPATGAAINALAANASLDIAAATSVLLVCQSATQWYSHPLLPS